MTKADEILTTIDISRAINCPRLNDAPHTACHGCRFESLCEAAREEMG